MQLLSGQSTLPPPAAIRETARNIVSRPYFELDSAKFRDEPPLLFQIIGWLLKPFFWLFNSLSGLPDAVRWLIVITCVVLCALLIAHIFYTLLKAIRGPALHRKQVLSLSAFEVDPRELERKAELALAQQDYIGAIRLLFRAIVRRLEVFEKKKFRPGITNRELLGRYRSSPIAEPLLCFVNTIDLKWYGQMPCDPSDYTYCHNEHGRICQYIGESKPADRS
jgi:hypothetical protein